MVNPRHQWHAYLQEIGQSTRNLESDARWEVTMETLRDSFDFL